MDALEAKRHAFRTRWLAATEIFEPDALETRPLGSTARLTTGLIPRIVFREKAIAESASGRRPAALTRPRVARVAVRVTIAVMALAVTGVGLQRVFKEAPGYFESFTSQIVTRGAGSTRG
ncbi:hypothetical protein BH09PSE1_BH09PSE1_05100 [soil metagenome]